MYNPWKEKALTIRNTAYELYQLSATTDDEDALKTAENKVYAAIRDMSEFIGEIPTKDGKKSARVPANAKTDNGTLFCDVLAISVNRNAKKEVKTLTDARDARKTAKKELKEKCFNSNGIMLKGENIEKIAKEYDEKIKALDNIIAEQLKIKKASIFATAKRKDGAFLKDFEICIRKVITSRYNFTAEELKADKNKSHEVSKASKKQKGKAKAEAKASAFIV